MCAWCGCLAAIFLSSSLQAEAAKESCLTGVLVNIQADDLQHRPVQIFHYLHETVTGRWLLLRSLDPGMAESLAPGSSVRVWGSIDQDELTIHSPPERLITAPVVVAQNGKHRTLVIALNFQDDTLHCGTAAIAELLFGETNSVDALYTEISDGKSGFAGDVVGPFTIPFANSTPDCNYLAWASAADSAARNAGIAVDDYQHKIYVLPNHYQCNWSGLATVGGSLGLTWIMDCNTAEAYAHELGHNLGLRHAASDPDNNGSLDEEYGDGSDIMGRTGLGLRQLNAPHKEQLGWLTPEKIVSPQGPALIQLAPLEMAPGDVPYPQVIKISRPPGNDAYYFSYRRPLGFDVHLLEKFQNALSVHHSAPDQRTYLIGALTDNIPFVDATTGLTVTMRQHDDISAAIQVSYECYSQPPSLTMGAAPLIAVIGFETLSILTVSNRDSSTCAPTLFQLQSITPARWISRLNPSTIRLAPGQSETIRLTFTVTGQSHPSIGVTMFDVENPEHTSTVTRGVAITKAVIAPDFIAPTQPEGVTTAQQKHSIRIRWNQATDNIAVRGYVISRDGVELSRTRRPRFNDRTVVGTTPHQYTVVAFDAAGNVSIPSQPVNFAATVPF